MNLIYGHAGHIHFWDAPITRRKFFGAAALAGGAAVTAGVWLPQLAKADLDTVATVAPRPIPGGVMAFGVKIHHFPPTPLFSSLPLNEPSEITDFNGLVGQTRVRGTGTGTDTSTGIQTPLNFQVDNGFMSGLYVGDDGNTHHGTFAFVWMDLYKKGQFVLANQVHDFNPGIPPSGLFWVQAVPEDALEVNLEAGTATLALNNLVEGDFHNVQNAILGGAGDPASVSYHMTWTAKAPPMNVTDTVNGFTGRFQISTMQIEWSATAPNFTFVSDPAATSVDVRSVMGRERNGIFFDE